MIHVVRENLDKTQEHPGVLPERPEYGEGEVIRAALQYKKAREIEAALLNHERLWWKKLLAIGTVTLQDLVHRDNERQGSWL